MKRPLYIALPSLIVCREHSCISNSNKEKAVTHFTHGTRYFRNKCCGLMM